MVVTWRPETRPSGHEQKHPTSNDCADIGPWMFDVRCWMLDVLLDQSMPDKRPLNVPALLAPLGSQRLGGPELFLPDREGKITLPNGERCGGHPLARFLGVWYGRKNVFHHRLVAELILGVKLSQQHAHPPRKRE